MSFDEEPQRDIHDQCRFEIESQAKELSENNILLRDCNKKLNSLCIEADQKIKELARCVEAWSKKALKLSSHKELLHFFVITEVKCEANSDYEIHPNCECRRCKILAMVEDK